MLCVRAGRARPRLLGCKPRRASRKSPRQALVRPPPPPPTSRARAAGPGSFALSRRAGLTEAELKGADLSAAACEQVCCKAKAISDDVATGKCGVWQWLDLKTSPGGGCWLGLEPSTRQPPYAENARSGEKWIGASGNLGPSSNWGWALILTLLIGGAVYVLGGIAHAVKVKGEPPGLGALPHQQFWTELAGLVVDGAGWTKARVLERASGDGQGALVEKLAPDAAAPTAAPQGSEAEAKTPASEPEGQAGDDGGGSDSDDDSLVE